MRIAEALGSVKRKIGQQCGCVLTTPATEVRGYEHEARLRGLPAQEACSGARYFSAV
jgi:hypothetical protein